jgi:hypothetical protein
VVEYWSGAVVCLLITDLLITFGSRGTRLADERELVSTSHFSRLTSHFSLFTSPLTSPFY